MKTFYTNQTYFLEISIIDTHGDFVTSFAPGEVTYIIKKSSDGSTIASGNMTIEGNSWKVEWTPTLAGEYRVEYITLSDYENGGEIIIVEDALATQASVDLIATETDKIKYILGLSQSDFRIFNPTYDTNSNLLTSTVKIYTSASDCNSDINAIASYSVVATYDSNGDMQTYKVTKN